MINLGEIVHELAIGAGLKLRFAAVSDEYPPKLLRYHKGGYYYTFIPHGINHVYTWRYRPSGEGDHSKIEIDLCNPQSFEDLRDFVK